MVQTGSTFGRKPAYFDSSRTLAILLERVNFGCERVRIMRNDKPMAVLIPVDDMDLLELLEDKIDLLHALEALEAYDNGTEESISLDEWKKKLGIE